jgi:3-vinyl bacteriochlorophyllide hydratase
MFTSRGFGRILDGIEACPWGTVAGRSARCAAAVRAAPRLPLYTAAERARRDASPWTIVQGVLAPLQFAVFLVSLALVLWTLTTGESQAAAEASIIVKTLVLYTIMVTGAIWEKAVFGRYLFARAFFWEDVFSMLVLALHTAYLVVLFAGIGGLHFQLFIALAAYAAYLFNAAQFVLKLRAARRDQGAEPGWRRDAFGYSE